jgi:hypothetical protein
MRKSIEDFLQKLRVAGLPDNQFRELVVISDRLTNILGVLGLQGISKVTTDLRTEIGKPPLMIIESEVPYTSKPAKQIITNICKAYVFIAVGDEVFESKDEYSGHLTYVITKLEKGVLMHIEMPFWDGCVTALGNRTMMQFLDIVTEG